MAYLGEFRIDAKCGKSGIAKGKKCKKGFQGGGSAFQQGNFAEKALIGSGSALAVGGLAAGIVQGARGNFKGAHRSLAASHGGMALGGSGVAMQGRRQKDKKKQRWGEGYTALSGVLAGGNAAVAHPGTTKRIAKGIKRRAGNFINGER